jgi:colanic acid/amylovoran biosynthesis glycosyltransferase
MSSSGPSTQPAVPVETEAVAAQYLATFLKPEMLHIYRQITALREFRPLVLCQKRENPGAFPFDNIHVLPKARTRAWRRFWQKQILQRPITIYRSEARRIEKILRDARARVLHIYFGHIGVHLLPLLEITHVPAIVSFHGADLGIDVDKPAHLALSRRMFDRAALLLVRSESLAKKLADLGADSGRIRLHRTGIPLGEIPFQKRVPPADGAWLCVQACRLIPKKGLTTTIRAFAEFAREYPKATLAIAGEGPQLEELKALTRKFGIENRVDFTGFLPQAELRALYARAHFFLHPSETAADGDQEGVPNSMLEAMASGLPVFATIHGGIPEAVERGTSGWLVAERDHAGLAHALLTLAKTESHYSKMSAAAATRVSALFDLTNQARTLEGYYREAISLSAKKLPK